MSDMILSPSEIVTRLHEFTAYANVQVQWSRDGEVPLAAVLEQSAVLIDLLEKRTVEWARMKSKATDADARIHELEEACRVLGEEVVSIAKHYNGDDWRDIVPNSVLAHPEASKWVKEQL